VIEVRYRGTLGNKLFQYAVGRNLAIENGLALKAEGIAGFPNTFVTLHGKKYYLRRQFQQGHKLEPISSNRKIILDGLFQNVDYLPNREVLNQWFHGVTRPSFEMSENELALSVRRGWNNYPTEICPPASHYVELLTKLNFKKVFIFTDSPNDPFFIPIINSKHKVDFFVGNPLEQFAQLRNAKNIVMAPSSFTFWAAHLGQANNVFWPRVRYLQFQELDYNWFDSTDSRNRYVD
jgi:hypothetical protein